MMTTYLPVCQLCKTEVTGTTSTTQNIFTEEGIEETFFTVTLSCGCIVDFPTFDVDVNKGTQTLKDGFTNQAVLTYLDADMLNDGDYDYEIGDDE